VQFTDSGCTLLTHRAQRLLDHFADAESHLRSPPDSAAIGSAIVDDIFTFMPRLSRRQEYGPTEILDRQIASSRKIQGD
jgi:hypothetical protein